jgi:EAL domain-containing protein (putative c-di-GMP-specific phosphodiesterase class I)/ABC-type amino acid transport substrate-binding protein/GGDEF domain-containing protein
MKNRRLKHSVSIFLCLILLACIFAGVLTDTVHAEETRTVKVAFFPMNGYHTLDENGGYTGMDVEYLEVLSNYANWKIEYVECADWDAALKLVADHKADLVGSAQYSAERAATYQYADLSSGYTFGIIATNPDSSLAYEDFEAMKDITFGMVRTYVRKEEFLGYLADNGISSPKIREYDSTADLHDALDRKEVDALVHTFMEIREGQRLIGRFAPRPFYYITYQGNDDVIRELNNAVADLKMNEPGLETQLMNRFYQSKLDKTIVFTIDEKKYIAEKGTIKVGYFDSYYPFVYEEDGECKGLTKDMFEGIASMTGLTLSWCKVENPEEASAALENNEIDVMSYCVHAESEIHEHNLSKMKDYVQVPLVFVTKKRTELDSVESLATVSYLSDTAEKLIGSSDTKLLIYDTPQDCLDAVNDKKADSVLCDGYLTEYLLSSQMKYYDLEIKSVLSDGLGISMTVHNNYSELAGILNKTLLTIDARAVNDYMLESNVYSLASVGTFIQENSVAIIFTLITLMMIIIFVAVHIIRNAKKIQHLMYKDVEIDIGNLNYLIYTGKKTILSERTNQYAAVYLNILQFQRYKVIYGWNNGQKLLAMIADALSECVAGKDEVCAKADGDHFAFLLSDAKGDIPERVRNIRRFIEERIFQEIGSRIEVQMGIYFIPPESDDLRGAIDCASQAIDFIESGSEENIQIYDDALENALRERHKREKLLDSVDIEENFVTYYQAKVDVNTEEIVGAEALVRFLDPTASQAVRSPGFFISYYEQTGRVIDIDFFVLRCACRMLRRRMDRGEKVVTISCNFSRMHFVQPDFAKRFEHVLAEYDIPKNLIEVEITETLVMEEMQENIAKQTLDDLHAKGIRLSIDDFGAGYSSLGVIEKIPASVIKLDRSFLLNQEDRGRQVKIMKSIVDLADSLGSQIVCEGVETEADVELMREIGASVAQGYRYAKPVSEKAFEERLAQKF